MRGEQPEDDRSAFPAEHRVGQLLMAEEMMTPGLLVQGLGRLRGGLGPALRARLLVGDREWVRPSSLSALVSFSAVEPVRPLAASF